MEFGRTLLLHRTQYCITLSRPWHYSLIKVPSIGFPSSVAFLSCRVISSESKSSTDEQYESDVIWVDFQIEVWEWEQTERTAERPSPVVGYVLDNRKNSVAAK